MSPILPIETIARPALRGPLEEIAVRRRHGEILATRRADEILRRSADERPRDHPADVEPIAEAAADPAEFIEPLEAEGLLVRGDLENRIGRGVADRFPRP